jgi:uncharacterized protein (TIGR03437 family)
MKLSVKMFLTAAALTAVAITANGQTPPTITSVVSAASWQAGPVAPGELIVIGGQAIGPIALAASTIPASGSIATTLGGTTVTINNVQAPILYTSASETSVQVPNYLIFDSNASIVVQAQGQASQPYVVAMAATTPGLFAANSSGAGQLVALNQDGTLNSPTNAAAGGTTITLYATGEGATDPTSLDGAIQSLISSTPYLPVTLTIGGQSTAVFSAGTPVGTLSGVMVIKALVPTGLTPGPAIVVLSMGPPILQQISTSQNVTVSVK